MQRKADRAQKLIIMVTPTRLKKESQIFALPHKFYLKFSFCVNLNLFCDFILIILIHSLDLGFDPH